MRPWFPGDKKIAPILNDGVGLHSAQILYGIHDHACSYRYQQNVGRHAHITVSPWRRAQYPSERRRQIIKNYVARKLPANVPFFVLTGRHAAVMLFDQSRRAMPGTRLFNVIVMDSDSMLVEEIVVFSCLALYPHVPIRSLSHDTFMLVFLPVLAGLIAAEP